MKAKFWDRWPLAGLLLIALEITNLVEEVLLLLMPWRWNDQGQRNPLFPDWVRQWIWNRMF